MTPWDDVLESNDPRAAGLLACPFCGWPAALRVDGDHHGGYFSLGCSRGECCAARVYYTEPVAELDEAIEAWNTRIKGSQ